MFVEAELKKIGNYLYVNLNVPDAGREWCISASVLSSGKIKKYTIQKESHGKETITPYYPLRKRIDGIIWRNGNNFSLVAEEAEKITFDIKTENGSRKKTISLAGGETIKSVEDALDMLKSIFLLYNSNIDKIKYVDDELKNLAKKYNARPYLHRELRKPEDLFSAILFSMKTGEPMELPMNEETAEWVNSNINANKKRMGGQAGIMANFLTSMGVNTIVYTPLLSEEQCSLFSGDVLIVTDSGLKHPSNAKRPDDKKINWVFEYNKGDVLCGIMATTSCRFIAAARPDTFRIKNVNIKFAKNADCVIISGFQGIKEKYNDGETCNEQFKKSQNMIMKLKEMKKPVHLELASIKNDNTRKQVIEKIIPLVDSMGMDDMELADMLSAVGEKTLAGKIRKSRGVIDVFNGLIELKKRFAPEKIQLHGDCYLLSICDHDYHVTPEEIKKSMEFASIAAAAKAIGKLNSRSDVWNGLTVEESKSAGKKEKILEGYLRKRGTVLKDGIAKLRKTNVIFVRSRMAPQVEDVVGLGDIISASIFAAENAYRLSNTKK